MFGWILRHGNALKMGNRAAAEMSARALLLRCGLVFVLAIGVVAVGFSAMAQDADVPDALTLEAVPEVSSDVDDLGLDSVAPPEDAGLSSVAPSPSEVGGDLSVDTLAPVGVSDDEPSSSELDGVGTGVSGGASVPVVPESVEAEAIPGLEMAEDHAADAMAESAADQAEMPATPAKTEQGFQDMLNRKGRAGTPTVDSVKRMVADIDGKPFTPDRVKSLFFTHWQHEALVDAKRSRGNVRPPTEGELNALGTLDKVRPENRDLALSGIVFVRDDDWTIWLNGMRITPSAIPREIIDLRVYKDYIEVKWLDDYSNQIFPIRMRAHQRFNLDMRIFLPGI